MALIKCEECGREISSSAQACPHCGAKSSAKKYNDAASLILIAIVIVAVGGYCFMN